MFRTLKVAFLSAGLDRLVQISQSRVTPHVRAIVYEIPEQTNPLIESYDYFQTRIYTPTEYDRDEREMFWTFEGKRVRHSIIFHYFSARVREQRMVLKKADSESLMIALPRSPKLDTFELYLRQPIANSLVRWPCLRWSQLFGGSSGGDVSSDGRGQV